MPSVLRVQINLVNFFKEDYNGLWITLKRTQKTLILTKKEDNNALKY